MTTVLPCGCCRTLLEPHAAFLDTELQAHVCDDCRRELRAAKAWLGHPTSPPGGGYPAMPINLHGVYRCEDAGDNNDR